MALLGRPYLLIITNLFCNHKCSYCIQQKSSLDVRMNGKKIDVPAVLKFLEQNRINPRSVKVMGGESTLHPQFEELMDGLLRLYKKIVLTTNINGKWYRDFDTALEKMKRWGTRIQWNSTFHPEWMEADLYIERIRKMREAGLKLSQVATTDTPDLTPEIAEKMNNANIGWKLQTFTGRNAEGRLLPQTWEDVNTKYPQLYDPAKYIDNYQFYTEECEDANYSENLFRPGWISCTTDKFLIGPDNNVYPCHRHLYVEDKKYIAGNIYDVNMEKFKYKWNNIWGNWTLPCNTKCNPCDFGSVKIKPLKKAPKKTNTTGVNPEL
ncbi:MAG: radical SAM protein [Bdellovibrionales bacterium]|nr:radical SAM protein [Bdellovibrionales bacterium]